MEKIEKIIAKIDSDPESEEVKEAEKHLWEKIYKKSGQINMSFAICKSRKTRKRYRSNRGYSADIQR